MNSLLRQIRSSLSLRLTLGIMGVVALVFVVTIGILFSRSKAGVQQIAIEQTQQMLENTAHHLKGALNEVEVATNNTEWQVMQQLQPDAIMALSRQTLEINPTLIGCSMAFEPYYFPNEGKYFSAYSLNEEGHIDTEQEGGDDYVYFDMDWYREPMRQRKACWIDPFFDSNLGAISGREIIASYCKPLVTDDGRFIGVISTDITQQRLSQLLMRDQLYLHSYYVLLGKDGQIIASGNEKATLDDLESSNHLVLRELLPGTGWTLTIVCPKKEIFKGYYQLVSIVITIITLGLLLMLLCCYLIVRRTVSPVSELAHQARNISSGQFNTTIAHSKRIDEIGQLQNSFAVMQQSIGNYVADLQRVKNETEQRNKELQAAKNQAEEADRKKTAFIQDLFHQIRTPLNIINGFAQVLRTEQNTLREEEKAVITHDMQRNSHTIATIIDNWMKTLALEKVETLECRDMVSCNDVCREAAGAVILRNPASVILRTETTVPDNLCIRTDKELLLKILGELLHNANKYTQQGMITLSCEQKDADSVSFIVTDTGLGIPEYEQERVFTQFTKLNNFNEGLGMGLTLCRQLATLLGGTLNIDAAYIDGTRFVLVVPRPRIELGTKL